MGVAIVFAISAAFATDEVQTALEPILSPRNLEVPFPYLVGSQREWPILAQALPEGTRFELVARDGDTVLASGAKIEARGLEISITMAGRLRIIAKNDANPGTIHLDLTMKPTTSSVEKQTLEIRPAPPDRPISYYADFGDDLIRMFLNSATGKMSPVTKNGFDQHFRRLQAHGTRRLIVWLSPFPFIADGANYPQEDWERYREQSLAILNDDALTLALDAGTRFASWRWLRYLLATRLDSEFGHLLGQSAVEHGIHLTVCYRPFEAALTKYYEVPVFDQQGAYLWGFLPLASPMISNHPEQIGWRNYRDVLREIGQTTAAELRSIEFPGVTNPEQFVGKPGLQIIATPYPPLADNSFVLVRDTSNKFHLRPFESLRDLADHRRLPINGFQVEAAPGGLRLTGISCPRDCRYLILTWTGEGKGPELFALSPVIMRAIAGNRLGRETTYWVMGGPNDQTRVAGITADGEYRAEFQASEVSQRTLAAGPQRQTFDDRQLVIDLGAPAAVEMIDFNQPLARRNAVREIATVLQQPGFDEVILNTRSHVDLPVSLADGDQGTRPVGLYWHERRGPRIHLGLDKAYLPRSASSLELIRELAKQPDGIERITTWQPDEWRDECQTTSGPRWRFARNRGTADGVRLLLEDLESAFPGRRIRMMIPPSESAVQKIFKGLDLLKQSTGATYGRGIYYQLWPSNNHNPAVGEGVAMVDLRGLSVEPTFLGSGGYLPGMPPFELYIRECAADMANNRGSRFLGPRSYFFEAQTTLRATNPVDARRAREAMICHLLAQRANIGEVILYESADWLYFFPLSDTDLCSHGFLDRCGQD